MPRYGRESRRPLPRSTTPSFVFQTPLADINLTPGANMQAGRPLDTSSGGRGFHSLLPHLTPGSHIDPSHSGSQAPDRTLLAIPSSSPQMIPTTAIRAPWMSWESLAVNLSNVPDEVNTYVLWQAFKNEGHIFSIDLFEDAHGKREHRGKVRFKFVFTSYGLYIHENTDIKQAAATLGFLEKRHLHCHTFWWTRRNYICQPGYRAQE